MPCINRIRVNNVKYNFGTQVYDDFVMNMYGKNTLYDLANGGGKSVLMLLLMQNMIPNCTLDDKQPIEKLFRSGNGNTTIHSLVEWKLDNPEQHEGYRFMTTGFCARKADKGDENEGRDIASVEYFNYCIFYRDYNANDIVNLPLSDGKERVGFSSLKKYLKDLGSRDMSLEVKVFERKGEYQSFISAYGINESHWEIIRGINKTEGHVRTYFETNYKTTRKVVEDLLIEEIIEKAYRVKTESEGDRGMSMAKMLMDIRAELIDLSKKKKEISSYDHQAELIRLLSDRIVSFKGIYEKRDNAGKIIAGIAKTAADTVKATEAELEELKKARDEAEGKLKVCEYELACLNVAKDRNALKVLMSEAAGIENEAGEKKKDIESIKAELELAENGNDYLEYVEEAEKRDRLDKVIKTLLSGEDFDEEELYSCVAGIKHYTDARLEKLDTEEKRLLVELLKKREESESLNKLVTEAQLFTASARAKEEMFDDRVHKTENRLNDLRLKLAHISLLSSSEDMSGVEKRSEELKDKLKEKEDELYRTREESLAKREQLDLSERAVDELLKKVEEYKKHKDEYEQASERIKNMVSLYGVESAEELEQAIREREYAGRLSLAEAENRLRKKNKRIADIEKGILIEQSEAVKTVLAYIKSRYGSQALSGMDYISALDAEVAAELIDYNPRLCYGIVAKDYDRLADDPVLNDMRGLDMPVMIYDMDSLYLDKSGSYDGRFAVGISAGALTSEEAVQDILNTAKDEAEDEKKNCRGIKDMLDTYAEDISFLKELPEEILNGGADGSGNPEERLERAKAFAKERAAEFKVYEKKIEELYAEADLVRKELDEAYEDLAVLKLMRELESELADAESKKEEAAREAKRSGAKLEEYSAGSLNKKLELDKTISDVESIKRKKNRLLDEWNNIYMPYYDPDRESAASNADEEELKSRFTAIIESRKENADTIEDKKALLKAMDASKERIIKSIVRRGGDIGRLEAMYKEGALSPATEDYISSVNGKYKAEGEVLRQIEKKLAGKKSEADKLSGSLEYMIRDIEKQFPDKGYDESRETLSVSEVLDGIKDCETTLKELKKKAKESGELYREKERDLRNINDIYKDSQRIVRNHELVSDEDTVIELKDMSAMFEEALVEFDKANKHLERAGNELMRFKGRTTDSLTELKASELSATIRDEVNIPKTTAEAQALTDNLKSITEFIYLEKDRVVKSLTDMENLKKGFEEQCLQRCMDVKTELEKLPGLSTITMDGEEIKMVGLSIPYVKEEFLPERMSEYITKIAETADSYDSESERLKYIGKSLSMKRLFSVMVTDMNRIVLTLYKRERIKEQSRYLKYEEAVGSTGQSQGIYIQFLIAVINYISGMYSIGSSAEQMKTIFIDNPFGAAKDIYIWEPIFALLKANNVQLIVPARGATPAITGRFDVNYVLGQKMSDGKQLTVVTNYTSNVDQQELFYSEMDFEQTSFDFI
ncbi:MAG: hypothetical protein IKO61_11365 [Lachnospiraceae bacterium]|nr:hypothetical protein [Lachnospiraceae bacterium]